MNIQLLSDIHTERHHDQGLAWANDLDPAGVDVVIAGDLCYAKALIAVLGALCQRFKHVVYVLGNHEFYGKVLSKEPLKVKLGPARSTVLGYLSHLGDTYPNFHFLENSHTTIDGQRFIGCSLWFPHRRENPLFYSHIWDFDLIRDYLDWVYDVNKASQAFLNEQVQKDDVVVTHYLPHWEGVHRRWRGAKGAALNRFFLCDMAPLIERVQPKLWLFGHTHDSIDTKVGDTRLVCNPFGYLDHDENEHFDPELFIEI